MTTKLSEEYMLQRWRSRIRGDVFTQARPSRSPVIILIGGQPGAGKTEGTNRAIDRYPDQSITRLGVDDLRRFHPDYARLRDDPDAAAMPRETAAASARWLEMSIQHALSNSYSVAVEGTFRNPDITLNTARAFAEAGFDVHVVGLAVPSWQSWPGCLSRYYSDRARGKPARWAPMDAHDAGYRGAPRTVAAAQESSAVRRLTIVDRAGVVHFDHDRRIDMAANQQDAVSVLERVRSRPPTAAELTRAYDGLVEIRRLASETGEADLAEHRQALERVNHDLQGFAVSAGGSSTVRNAGPRRSVDRVRTAVERIQRERIARAGESDAEDRRPRDYRPTTDAATAPDRCRTEMAVAGWKVPAPIETVASSSSESASASVDDDFQQPPEPGMHL